MKVVQTDLKMQSLVVSIIIPSFKEIGQEMSEYKPMLKDFFVVGGGGGVWNKIT